MTRAIIIEDENLARTVIRKYLSDHDDVEIISECANGFEGLKAIQEEKPDLIFLDIQMPKLSGFELLELLDDPPVIIFSTAFDEYALRAFEMSAADYLLKPYTKKRFDEALSKALSKIHDGVEQKEMAEKLKSEPRPIDRIAVRNGTRISIIPASEIIYIEAQDDYVAVHTGDGKFLKQLTMKYLESALPSEDFVRVHRSYLLAVAAIDRLEAYSKDSYLAILKTGDKVPVSRTGYGLMRKRLGF